ncbi:G1 family glutamic endopeptidase [Catenulispora subtropica]|uniref:G1 family endopeptidase n=1 Tax=Catenulispora subtropica TaxID=450798 RepID=A0ABN2SUY5_9ACTN
MSSARRWVSAGLALSGAISAAVLSSPASAAVFNGTAQGLSHGFHSSSGNWSGYAATGRSFTSVSASWTQPAVSCGSQTTYSSFWVGLDGDGSNSVEQTGTEADCSGGRAVYSSWYEMYPAYPVDFSNPVSPGDHFTASVTYNGGNKFTLVLSDTTKGWSHTVHSTLRNPALASAEVIAEAPSSGSGVLPLSDFGTVGFSGSKADGASLSSFSPDKITMAGGSTIKAVPGTISSSGAFSVTWKHS